MKKLVLQIGEGLNGYSDAEILLAIQNSIADANELHETNGEPPDTEYGIEAVKINKLMYDNLKLVKVIDKRNRLIQENIYQLAAQSNTDHFPTIDDSMEVMNLIIDKAIDITDLNADYEVVDWFEQIDQAYKDLVKEHKV